MLSGQKFLPADVSIKFAYGSWDALRTAAEVGAELAQDSDIRLVLRVGACHGLVEDAVSTIAPVVGLHYVSTWVDFGDTATRQVLYLGNGNPKACNVAGVVSYAGACVSGCLVDLARSLFEGNGLPLVFDSVYPGIDAVVVPAMPYVRSGFCCVPIVDVFTHSTEAAFERYRAEVVGAYVPENLAAILEIVNSFIVDDMFEEDCYE